MTGFAARLRDIRRSLASLRRDVRGVIALKFALVVPAVALLAIGAIDLTAVNATRDRLQGLADGAALAGAPSLSLATDGAAARERAAAFFQAQMTQWSNPPKVDPTYTIIDQGGQRALRVVVKGHRASFFGSMLPPGGWNFTAQATASTVGLVPLCVLVTGGSQDKGLKLEDGPRMAAPGCMIHSNQHIQVLGGSISAARVQAVGTAVGVISPTPGTGAAHIPDPFADVDLNSNRLCDVNVAVGGLISTRVGGGNNGNNGNGRSGRLGAAVSISSGVTRLPAGVHCGAMVFGGDSELILEPGDHWFIGSVLTISDNAKLTGRDVVMFFDKPSRFDFSGRARVNLSGRESGPYAGMVMGATRDNIQKFSIDADNVEALLGVIYIPEARLVIGGTSNIARDSAWTVIVAKYLELQGSPTLHINANYNTSRIPVPAGVGPNTGGAHLVD